MLLTREELWYVVVGAKPEPVTEQWKKDDSKARATMGLCIEDNQFGLVKTANSASDFWNQLKAYHEKSTVTSRVSLLKKLCSLNLAEGGDVEGHLVVLEDLFDRLANAGQELEESLRIAMILRSLPDSYGDWSRPWRVVPMLTSPCSWSNQSCLTSSSGGGNDQVNRST
ncbi:uncharacterized protein LOC134286721 [Aedes albopictus]|uniref:Uncharacterized protein n=1 Tax=Aedes albopictus TaxID=7160 RepID=A0ABM1Z9Z8_AEDAL